MKSRSEIQEEYVPGTGANQRPWIVFLSVLILAGGVAFLVGIFGTQAVRAWQAYLINYVFWTGLAFGALLFSATLTMTNATWGRPLKRLAEAPAAFLPVAFALFWVLYFGKDFIFSWIHHPIPEKALWLNAASLFIRDGISILLLTVVSLALVYYSVRRDLIISSAGVVSEMRQEDLDPEGMKAQSILSPVFGIGYAIILSLIGFDLIMSLSPRWYSTLFGAYYFIGSFYTGLAALVVLAGISVKLLSLERYITSKHFHDLGNLLMAFCLMSADFFYCQFLVIWYGNLPEETRYVILRVHRTPWYPLAWIVLLVAFVLPFIALLFRKIKRNVTAMIILGAIVLLGMWLERYLLVAPSLWKGERMPLGLMELLITAGFFGIVAICMLRFFRKFPLFPISDPFFQRSLEAAQNESSGHGG